MPDGKPRKKAPTGPTSAKAWKSQSAGVELQVPSGNVALVKSPKGMQHWLTSGQIPNSLMPLVRKAISGKTKGIDVEAQLQELEDDPQAIVAMAEFMDRVVCDMVIQPRVHLVPENEEDRDPDLLYVDEVDMEDKAFIMNYAMGGSRDLERFRNQHDAAMAAISGRPVVELPAE